MTRAAKPAPSFTVLDWLGTIVTDFAALALLAFPIAGRSFASMLRDFGGASELPLLTRLAVSGWFPVTLGVVVVTCLGAGTLSGPPLSRRRAFVVAGFMIGCAGFAMCLVGVYLPVFDLGGAIKAE